MHGPHLWHEHRLGIVGADKSHHVIKVKPDGYPTFRSQIRRPRNKKVRLVYVLVRAARDSGSVAEM
jgi:hypothetical protein